VRLCRTFYYVDFVFDVFPAGLAPRRRAGAGARSCARFFRARAGRRRPLLFVFIGPESAFLAPPRIAGRGWGGVRTVFPLDVTVLTDTVGVWFTAVFGRFLLQVFYLLLLLVCCIIGV